MTVAERLKSVVDRCDDVLRSPSPDGVQDTRVVEALSDLAQIVRSVLVADDVGAPALELGREYEIVLRVRASVSAVSESHGRAYELTLTQRDYVDPRVICVDEDEIQSAR